jgi:hypothetical protein
MNVLGLEGISVQMRNPFKFCDWRSSQALVCPIQLVERGLLICTGTTGYNGQAWGRPAFESALPPPRYVNVIFTGRIVLPNCRKFNTP